jgi:hypothetical protein
MRYAYVENGKIVDGPRGLPKAWKNISGLNLLPEADLIQLGWLPWRFVDSQPESDMVQAPSTIEIKATEIVETKAYRPKTQSEKDAEEQSRIESNRSSRAYAYREESDPLFFKAQRGEIPIEEWLDKVNEIKQRFPTV